MFTLIVQLIAVVGFLIGLKIYRYWFNPITVYTGLWSMMVILYNLRLIRYADIMTETWLYIGGAYLCLLLGTLTIHLAANLFPHAYSSENALENFTILNDGGETLKKIILIFSIIGLIGAIQHWYVLFNKYGSFVNILMKTNEIYRLRVEGKLDEVIPYLPVFSYIAVFLAAIYSAYKNKFTGLVFLPITAVFLKEIANVGRAGILLSTMTFISTYFVTKYFYKFNQVERKAKILRTVLTVGLIFGFFIGSSLYTRAFRSTIENMSGTSRALSGFKENLLISPSIYLYLSAHIGVFNKFLQFDKEKSEPLQYTFQPVYNILYKFGVTEKTRFYHEGYYFPAWVNTGTYLRELYADYGIWGIFFIPYLIGLLMTYNWKKFIHSGNIFSLIILIQFYGVIFLSFFLLVTRFGVWWIVFGLEILFVPLIEKLAQNRRLEL